MTKKVRTNICAIDWAKKNDLAFLDKNGEIQSLVEKLSLYEVIKKYSSQFDTFVIESTFESYDLEEHNNVIDLVKKLGLQLFTINPRETAHFRMANELNKTDKNDAISILRMFLEGEKHFRIARKWNVNNKEDLNWKSEYKRIARLRNKDWNTVKTNKKLSTEYNIFQTIQQNTTFKTELGEPVGKKTKLSLSFVFPFILIALKSKSRKEFDKRTGLYGNGYSNILRSNFYYSRVNTLLKRHFGVKSLKNIDKTLLNEKRKETMKILRSAVRSIYAETKQFSMGKSYPEMGTGNPDKIVN